MDHSVPQGRRLTRVAILFNTVVVQQQQLHCCPYAGTEPCDVTAFPLTVFRSNASATAAGLRASINHKYKSHCSVLAAEMATNR